MAQVWCVLVETTALLALWLLFVNVFLFRWAATENQNSVRKCLHCLVAFVAFGII